MNLRPISGAQHAYKREDGGMHPDERRMNFGSFMDKAFPWVIFGLLAWLCGGQVTLQQQVAVLVERSTNQGGRMDRNTADIQGLRAAQSELQREVEEIKSRQSR